MRTKQKVTNLLTYDYAQPGVCNNFDFGTTANPRGTEAYATEHILELQTIANFIDYVNVKKGMTFPRFEPNPKSRRDTDFCTAIKTLWTGVSDSNRFTMDGVARDPKDFIMPVMPGNDNGFVNEFVLLDKGVNTAKKGVSSYSDPLCQDKEAVSHGKC